MIFYTHRYCMDIISYKHNYHTLMNNIHNSANRYHQLSPNASTSFLNIIRLLTSTAYLTGGYLLTVLVRDCKY